MLGKHINKHCEDSLTASVFSHLLHLPSEVFWRILRNACYTDSLPEFAGEPEMVEPWPNWNPEGTGNTNRVVPDLFLRFAEFDLIIEAKRWDANMQDPEQWRKELIAYSNRYGKEGVPVKLIALGGIRGVADDQVRNAGIPCTVHMCKWDRLLTECQRMKKELKRLTYSTSHTEAWGRILSDLIDLFAWHSFSTGLWFENFSFDKHRLSPSIARHLRLFQNRSSQLRTS